MDLEPRRRELKEPRMRKNTLIARCLVFGQGLGLLLVLTACTSAYYRALETVGIEKRDILVDRIDDTRDAQDDAKEQFSNALEQYRSVVEFEGGDLEEVYDRLNAEYEKSVRRAQAVRDRIDSVEKVAQDLFEEWEDEIEQYSDPDLARRSRELLVETRNGYGEVIAAMHRAEETMDPVLTLFNDQVMFLRHNLNARAIGALESELGDLEQVTATLIEEMERAIAEANAFIEDMS
jgi:predicted ribosome quality control (RQC) complex YloA/Tae2 family protein